MKRKGQAVVGAMIGLLVALIIGIGVVVPVIQGVITPATTLYGSTLENVTMRYNNTEVAVAHTPIDESVTTAKLYFYPNTTFQVPTARVDFSTTGVTIYTNGSYGYPNIGNGTTAFYYASYEYQPEGYVTNSLSRNILGYFILMIVVVIIVAIVALIGFK